MIDSTNIDSFVTLKKYYTVRNSITKLSNSVFMVDDQELQVYLDDLYTQIEELSTLSSSKKSIEEILLLVLKTLNTRLDKNTKKLFSKRYDFDKVLTSFPDNIQNELLRLKLKIDEFYISAHDRAQKK
jgi:cell division protein ZapA (FtsZ GTPase activity inhibitor)